MTTHRSVRPPASGSELRQRIMAEYSLSSAPALALLETAAQALDEAIAAEAIVATEGMVTTGPRGPKEHPAVGIARHARHRLLRAISQLHLEL